ncbi:hypothetical protein [Jannaschia sp. M317]|uniref:hypothetical protein n=1 Tax=Jannaschia sp. M317 TaxID=2867011 RepID=UPI0021A77BB6|nr:hypothetical protein [Jannaschia sp. M317]UWQ16240.1 hypothetical protein K3551_09875 [Jannaschia sp. M317]
MTQKTTLVIKMVVASVLISEALGTGAAMANVGNGPFFGTGLGLTSEGSFLYGFWMLNAALAIFTGLRSRPMLLLIMGFAVNGLIIGGGFGWAMVAVGSMALAMVLPMVMRGQFEDDDHGLHAQAG